MWGKHRLTVQRLVDLFDSPRAWPIERATGWLEVKHTSQLSVCVCTVCVCVCGGRRASRKTPCRCKTTVSITCLTEWTSVSFVGIRHVPSSLDTFDTTSIKGIHCGRGALESHRQLRLVAPCRFDQFSSKSVRRHSVSQRLKPHAPTLIFRSEIVQCRDPQG